LEQLAPDGILVIPIGGTDSQDLTIVRRIGDSFEFDQEIIEKVKFVPLLGGLSRQFL
jgi:protein-L-isoaspartate(D-aspartate) O-methyltransferase